MGLAGIGVERMSIKLHSRVYRWAAQHFDPGWVMDAGSELGVGVSLMEAANPKLRLIGCDLNLATLKASKNFNPTAGQIRIQADGAKLPIASAFLSGVCLINILHLVDEPRALLVEATRTLCDTGRVVIYIDLTKLPLRWEPAQLTNYLDRLLQTYFVSFEINDGQDWVQFYSDPLEGFSLEANYLRLGKKK